ncbi:cobalt/nickel transport system permease protein [Desulfitispora alkaliphila]|uniref:CbiM family transporter n=1 Tax=Desulfitispora alkaliphila TaxID=622674 RepID=UPI003D1C2E6D
MHLSDGVLSTPVVGVSVVVAGAVAYWGSKNIKSEEVPKISLITGAFFVLSLVSIPVGPTTIHPLLAGFMGIVLGRRVAVAVLGGLLLQAFIFQHGGITTLGANMLLVVIPSLAARELFYILKNIPIFWRGAIAGGVAVVGCFVLLVLILLGSSYIYGDGMFSVINILAVGYLPLAIVEGIMTGFAIKMVSVARPQLLERGVGV